ncbi:CDP-glucose 4,6-dehydratase [mine drainage metagenome]|uniref:CDP-glucose 4,6-dehydratase n=1 Tax=mine drainage metagenome TaxID=410659 RepID=A0A1J5RE36_9ZZZZ
MNSDLNLNSEPKQRAPFQGAFFKKRVLITGHTGFKGAWLTEWLLALGAKVTGFSLPPPTVPSLFEQLDLEKRIDHRIGDVRDLEAVTKVMLETRPDFVFHLAAQPLVRLSYDQPVETYATNVMGTVNVLEALRKFKSLGLGLRLSGGTNPLKLNLETSTSRSVVAVFITTDKCYENKEWVHGYREVDPMGGHDPYSSSKGAAELVISAYRNSYFSHTSTSNLSLNRCNVLVASARAGNVIGGGDWALDRIVPDCIRHLIKGEAIPVRNKVATRPWQHVLEPLSGYLTLASRLAEGVEGESLGLGAEVPTESERSSDLNFNLSLKRAALAKHASLCSAFNFGPNVTSNRTVADLVQEALKHWEGKWKDMSDPNAPHEAKLLSLTIDKAFHLLDWTPVWNFEETVKNTISWYRETHLGTAAAVDITRAQIAEYTNDAATIGLPWAGIR